MNKHHLRQTIQTRYWQGVRLLTRPFVQRLLLLGLSALVATSIGCSILLPHAIHNPGTSPLAFLLFRIHLLKRRG